jgi:hypothetical protein
MTGALLERSAPSASPPTARRLTVRRTDIVFANTSPECVAIEVTVSNPGPAPSAAQPAVLAAAPFGAFVPWRPLALLQVPELGPGQSAVLKTTARPTRPAPLGPPDRVPPRQLLTALGAADDRPRPIRPLGVLPPDLMQLLGQGSTHWAGNLNIFIGSKPVERHLARALRIYPGRVNLAMFVVGCGRDAYRFRLAGPGAAWGAALYDTTDRQALSLDLTGCSPVRTDDWVEVDRTRILFLAIQPPAGCPRGEVEVQVEQRSTGQQAVVEFSLDPAAAGPGCYVV